MNRIAPLLVLLALFASCVVSAPAPALAGGPDIEFKNAEVHHVVADNKRIVMIVSGRCRVFVADPDEPHGPGSAKSITTLAKNATITIARRDRPGSGYTNWHDHARLAKSLAGKHAQLQLQGDITIRDAHVASVISTASSIIPTPNQPKDAANN